MYQNNTITYLEIACQDIGASKAFFAEVFQWSFKDYGQTYSVFTNAGIEGSLYQAEEASTGNAVLVVLYHPDLPAMQQRIKAAGGAISKDIFAFPGGHRFHFTDPSGNEFALWSNKHT